MSKQTLCIRSLFLTALHACMHVNIPTSANVYSCITSTEAHEAFCFSYKKDLYSQTITYIYLTFWSIELTLVVACPRTVTTGFIPVLGDTDEAACEAIAPYKLIPFNDKVPDTWKSAIAEGSGVWVLAAEDREQPRGWYRAYVMEM